MSGYLLSEKYKRNIDNMLAQHGLDLTSGRRRGRTGGYNKPVSSNIYDGAFAVTKKDDTTATVSAGKVIAGITEKSVVATDVTISTECVLYMELTYVDSAYVVTFKTASSMPALSSSTYTEQLASITFEESKIKTITQVWEAGNIKVIGRVV